MKTLKRLLPTLLVLVTLLCGMSAQAESANSVGGYTFELEQVYVNVPQMDVFLYALDADGNSLTPTVVKAAGPTLTVGDTELELGTITSNTDSVCYFVVIDNSNKISAETFNRYKLALARICKNKRDNDQICVFTTAGGFECVLDATTEKKDVTRLILSIEQAEGSIDIEKAVSGLTGYVQANYQDIAPRKAIFAFTDATNPLLAAGIVVGLNSQTSSITYPLHLYITAEESQGLELLQKIPSDNATVLDAEELVQTVSEVQEKMSKALEIKTTVDESMYGQKLEEFTLAVPALGSAVKDTCNIYMGFRLEHPQVQSVEIVDRTTLNVTFNQKVKNAERTSNYIIKSDDAWDWHVRVKSVEVAEDGRSAVLTVEPLYNCNFTIGLHKVTSQQTSANISDEDETVEFTVTEWPKDNLFYLARFRLPLLIAAGVILALLIQAYIVRHREKSFEKRSEVEHMLADENGGSELMLPRRWVTLFIKNRREIAESRWSGVVDGSLMIGSDPDQCDLCIKDKKIAAQHCMLCVDGDTLLVRTLQDSAAVFVNGEKIGGEYRLQNNDTLSIGRTTIRLVL